MVDYKTHPLCMPTPRVCLQYIKKMRSAGRVGITIYFCMLRAFTLYGYSIYHSFFIVFVTVHIKGTSQERCPYGYCIRNTTQIRRCKATWYSVLAPFRLCVVRARMQQQHQTEKTLVNDT